MSQSMILEDWSLPEKEKFHSYLSGNSYRSEKYKLLYVATPKVACTTLKWWLASLEGYADTLRQVTDSVETDPELVIHDNFHKTAPHITGLSAQTLIDTLNSDSYFCFAVVRNPYKRIFSAWQSKLLLKEPFQAAPYLNKDFFNHEIKEKKDIATAFESFLEHLEGNEAPDFWDVHWTPQATLLRPDLIQYSALVKIENKKELSSSLMQWMGQDFVDPFATKSANESLLPYLPEFVTTRSAELIRALYAEDFEVFGYSKDLPDGGETLSEEQFELASKAIEFIRRRHQRMREMTSQIIENKQLLAKRDAMLVERDAMLAERDAMLAERDAVVNEIYRSHSWRLAAPLRSVEAFIRRLKNFEREA